MTYRFSWKLQHNRRYHSIKNPHLYCEVCRQRAVAAERLSFCSSLVLHCIVTQSVRTWRAEHHLFSLVVWWMSFNHWNMTFKVLWVILFVGLPDIKSCYYLATWYCWNHTCLWDFANCQWSGSLFTLTEHCLPVNHSACWGWLTCLWMGMDLDTVEVVLPVGWSDQCLTEIEQMKSSTTLLKTKISHRSFQLMKLHHWLHYWNDSMIRLWVFLPLFNERVEELTEDRKYGVLSHIVYNFLQT